MTVVTIAYAVARQIANHAAQQAPYEACGLLAGGGDHISAAWPLPNLASTPRARFQADPQAQLLALTAIDEAGLNWIGVYHSHPASAPIPSKSDIEECVDSGLLQLIVSLEHEKPRLKLWRIEAQAVTPIELVYENVRKPEQEDAPKPATQAALIMVAVAAVLILLIIAFTLLPPAPELAPAP